MASSPRLPTPIRSGSTADLSLHINPEIAGISDVRSYGQPKNYFQPINDHSLHNSDPVIAAPSTATTQNEAFTEPFVCSFEAEHVLVPDVFPHFFSTQTPSPVSSSLELRCDSLPVTQTLSLSVTSTGNSSKPPDLGTFSLSPASNSPAHLDTNAAIETPSPKPLLPTLEAVPSSDNADSESLLGQSTEHPSSGLYSHLLSEDVEGTSWASHYQGTDLKLVCGSSPQAADQASITECMQQVEDQLGRSSKEDKMKCILDEGLTSGDNFLESSANISDLHSTLNTSINPVDNMSEENVKPHISFQSTTAVPGFTPAEASLEMPSVSEQPTDVSVNQTELNQSDPAYLSPHMLTNTSQAKSGELVDYMSVSYLQVTKSVQKETQGPCDPNLSNQPVVTSTLLPNVEELSCIAPRVEVEDHQNQHGEQDHKHFGKGQQNTPVLSDPIPGEKENFICKVPRKICQPISHGSLEPGLERLPTNWTPQPVSGVNYTNYYGCVYPNYQNTCSGFSDQHSVHYPWTQNAWMDPRGYMTQTQSEAQFYGQNNQKKKYHLKQPEQSTPEHGHNSNELSPARQKGSKNTSAKADQDKASFYSTKFSEGWDSQGYYSPAYYQGYYYPYGYGYKSEVSKKHSHYYYAKPDTYDDWWRYDPRYDSTFDHDRYSLYKQPYGDQWDRQSCYSAYSTQSMPSTHSNDSHLSWHSEQSWGYQRLKYADCPYDKSAQSCPDGRDPLEHGPRNHYFDAGCSSESEKSSGELDPAIVEKFSTPHFCARFGPAGQLIQVLPNLPSEGKPALVHIHSTEMMLQGVCDQLDLKNFPGPLTKDKTHKADVLTFIKNKCPECLHEVSQLIWELMRLICRQNGNLVGTDVAHLLLRNQRSHCLFKKAASDLIDFTHEPLSKALENEVGSAESTSEDTERGIQHFRELLIFGKKKDALKVAISKGLWGHALMLASKMDTRAYSQVMSKFIDSLPESDVLRTFYQITSGRIPVSAVNCRFKDEEDWRTHLAMVLSNHTCFKHLHKKTITKMGDALASKGFSDAASFCYMVVQLDVDTQSNKSDIFLFGIKPNVPRLKCATNEAIQRTELFEYSLSIGTNSIYLPNFQVFKFIYACRLAEAGLCTQALQYCEVIARALLTTGAGSSLTLISQLLELSAKLGHFEKQLKDIPEVELQCEPEWMVNLKILHSQINEQLNATSTKEEDTDLLTAEKMEIMDVSPDNTGVVECDPSYEGSILTTEMPKQAESPPDIQLVLPASQDILESRIKAAPVESRQVLDSVPPEPDNNAFPLPTCPVSQNPSHLANENYLPEKDLTVGMETKAVSEGQLLTVPPSAARRPEKLLHTESADCLSEDQPNLSTETTPTLVLPQLAPPTHPQTHPVTTDPTTAQSQYTENLQYPPAYTDSMSGKFAVPTWKLPSTTSLSSLSLIRESELVSQRTVPLLNTPSFVQTGQPYQKQHPIPQPNVSVAPPPQSSSSIDWVTEQYLQEIQPVLPGSPLLLYEPLVQPLHPAVSIDRSQEVCTVESQTTALLTTPLPEAHISPPGSSSHSAKPSLHSAQTWFGPNPLASRLPADHMLTQNTPPLFVQKPYTMAEKTVHPEQMHTAPKPFTPKLFVPQSPVPDPQPEKELAGGWFSWLFRKKSQVHLATGTDKADVPNAKT